MHCAYGRAAVLAMYCLSGLQHGALCCDHSLSAGLGQDPADAGTYLGAPPPGARGASWPSLPVQCEVCFFARPLACARLAIIINSRCVHRPARLQGTPIVRKALVVAPASLVNNWAAEVKKWLGAERLRALVLSSQGAAAAQQVSDFKLGRCAHWWQPFSAPVSLVGGAPLPARLRKRTHLVPWTTLLHALPGSDKWPPPDLMVLHTTPLHAVCGTCCSPAMRACGALALSWRASATFWCAMRGTGAQSGWWGTAAGPYLCAACALVQPSFCTASLPHMSNLPLDAPPHQAQVCRRQQDD